MNIFISYNSHDGSFVTEVVERLRSINNQIIIRAKLFFDQDNLIGGESWVKMIQEALEDSDLGLVFIGEQGIGNWQNKEALALLSKYDETKGEFRIIPVIIDDSKKGQLQKNIPWFLADMQWIEFQNSTDSIALQRLMDSIAGQDLIQGSIPTGVCPYKGLDFFEVKDAPFFFGRTFDTNWIFYKKLQLSSKFGSRFLAIVGDSGSGKSSFARAGILANIKAGRFPHSETWKQIIFTPEDNPLLKLSAVLQSSGIVGDAKKMEEDARSDSSAFRRALEVYGNKVVVLIDQFEEVITQCKDNYLREAFLKNIIEGLKAQYLVCIITMRSDFYAAFSPFREFAELVENNNYTITSLEFNTSGDEWFRYLRSIIQKPARLLNVRIEPILTTEILEDCKKINGILPALQLALIGLWKKRTSNYEINSSDYESLTNGKGIAGIIESHANNVWNVLTKEGSDKHAENLIKAIFIKLLEVTSNKEDVRKTVNKARLIEELWFGFKQEEVEEMLNLLSGSDARLIRIKKDGAHQNLHWVEVVHEVLIRQWEMLRKWVNEQRDAINYMNKLEQYIDDDEKVLSGKKLVNAEQWIADHKDLTTPKINDFVRDSRGRVNKRRNIVISTLAASIFLIIIMVILYPIIECRNCALVNEFVQSNIDKDEIDTLTISDNNQIKYLHCFNNLKAVRLQAKTSEDRISQKDIDELPRNLQQLSITGFSTNDTVVNFGAFKNLKSLTLEAFRGVREINLTNLDSLSNLNLLGLDELSSFQRLVGIQNLKNVNELHLDNLFQLQSLKGIEGVKSLKKLTLKSLHINDLSAIKDLTNLEQVKLEELDVSNLEALNSLRQLQSLTLLMLRNVGDLGSIKDIAGHLQFLSLRLHIDSLDNAASLTNLQELNLQQLRITNLNSLANLHRLRKLSLSELQNNFTLEGVEKLSLLEDLSLSNLKLHDFGLLKALTNLQTLEISGKDNFLDVEMISSLAHLKSLTLADFGINKLSGVENLKNLEALSLRNLKIADLSGIENLSGLRSLELSQLPLNSLAGINKNVRILHLSYFENIGIADVRNLINLQSLSLSSITNLSLDGIEEFKTLTVLRLSDLANVVSISKLNPQIRLDTLIITNLKFRDLGFLSRGVSVKNVVYDDETFVSNKNLQLPKMSKDMRKTKFFTSEMLENLLMTNYQ